MAWPIKWLGPCGQRCQSISQEVEVISIPLNPIAYLGEIWLTSSLRLSTFHLFRTIAQWAMRLNVGFRWILLKNSL